MDDANELLETAENTPYKSFESQEEFEKFILNQEESIKEKIQSEVNLSAEEKLNARIKELESEKKDVLIDKNRTKDERQFVEKGIDGNAYKELLDLIVSDSEEITLNRTESLLKFIDASSKALADEKIKTAMRDVQTPEQSHFEEQEDKNTAVLLGTKKAEMNQRAAEIINKYITV